VRNARRLGAEVALWDIDAERLERARGELAKAGKVSVAVSN